jgi:hypothetical protein
LEEYAKKGLSSCPSSMPSYFENNANKTKGCTKGRYNNTLTGPETTTQPQCKQYPTMETNLSSIDSCYNLKELDEAECFGTNCKKNIVQFGKDTPVLIYFAFTDNTGFVPRNAYTLKSVEEYLNFTEPRWKEKGMFDTKKNVLIAEVAKAVFIDKTMDIKDTNM